MLNFGELMLNFLYPKLFFIFLILTIWSAPATSINNAYLDALDEEAELSSNLNPDINESAKPSPVNDIQQQQMQEYQLLLKNKYPATYNAYLKLDMENKKAVVSGYFEHEKNAAKASHILFNLYFESKKKKRALNESN